MLDTNPAILAYVEDTLTVFPMEGISDPGWYVRDLSEHYPELRYRSHRLELEKLVAKGGSGGSDRSRNSRHKYDEFLNEEELSPEVAAELALAPNRNSLGKALMKVRAVLLLMLRALYPKSFWDWRMQRRWPGGKKS